MLSNLRRIVSKAFGVLEKEEQVIEELHRESQAAIKRIDAIDPGFQEMLERAHAYAVFPDVGKAAAVFGGAFGKGEVFKDNQLVGYAAVAQLTIGVQLGGQTFTQVIAFESKEAFERFKQGKTAFAASASAVLVKAGAAASADYQKGAKVFVYSDGGMMLEAAIGGQRFLFRPAVLGRAKAARGSAGGRPVAKRPAARRRPATSKRARASRATRRKPARPGNS
jgi:lipid-binding SYLF domain-containing protein